MRVLVVGTTPPPGGAAALRLARVAAARLAAGDEVEVCSPDQRSAAHATARLAGLALPLHLARQGRRHDALVLRIEAGLPFGETTGRLSRAATLVALGLALRLYGEVEVHVDAPAPVPGGLGGRAAQLLWSRAGRVVVSSADDLDQLLAAPGVSPERVVLEVPHDEGGETVVSGWAAPTAEALRAEVLGLVRSRAARDRAVNAARVELGLDGPGPLPSSAFSVQGRARPSAAGVARVVGGKLRRVASGLLSAS